MTEDTLEENPICPNCGVELDTTIAYTRGHKTSDGYECDNGDCPEDWWHYTEWYDE